MTNSEFASFVASQQVPLEPPMDWGKERDQYIEYVEALYIRVSVYLAEYVASGSITLSYDEIEITEENLGSYRIKRMLVAIGRQTVFFEPVGTLLIGSKGRVDVIGPIKRVPIMLINSSVKHASDLIHVRVSINGEKPAPTPKPVPQEPVSWTWKVVSKQMRHAFEDLTAENLFAILLEVSKP